MPTVDRDTPTCVVVNLEAVRHNIGIVRQRVGPQCHIAAVVKANGYGHGAVPVARACLEAGADMLCVTLTAQAAELRQQFPEARILVFSPLSPSEVQASVALDLTPTVEDLGTLELVDREAAARGKVVKVHLQVDTGMSRTGIRPEEAARFMRQAGQCRHVDFEGIYSHFASADSEDLTFARRQMALFNGVVAEIAGLGVEFHLRHMANSAAVLALPESHLDMVRPGVMIYGLKPAPHLGEGLEPAMTVLSHILKLKTVPAGTPISYGCTYRCSRQQEIATVPMGYADGYRRGLSNRFHVVVRGQRAPVVGRVCMDMLMADVTDVPGVEQGDEVLILGKRDGHCVPAEQMAATLDTIPQEVVSRISRRLRRVYTDGKA